MLDESTGLIERRARTIVTFVLLAETLWAFLTKYLPLDAALWSLQAELVRQHFGAHVHDGWKLIPFPASNIGASYLSAVLHSFLSSEIAVRFLLTWIAIFVRGMGMVSLFRVLRVRDAGIYFLVPVLVMTGLWFTGSLPYLLGETLALWVLVYFLSQDHPRSSAFWALSIGLLFVSLLSGLAFVLSAVAVFTIMMEQRRSVHLSQGWLNEPRAVMGLLLLGTLVLALGFVGGEPIIRLSSSHFLPSGFSRLLFLLTPAPRILEATIRYGDILHILLTLLFLVVLLGCFARAYLLAIEEVTWQSRAMRSAGYFLLVLAIIGPFIEKIGIETSSGIIFAIVLILAGSYSRGPSVRRNPIDRLIYSLTGIAAIASLLLNGFALVQGSAAALDVIHSARSLVADDREKALQDEHLDHIRIRFNLDSSIAASASYVGTISYSATAPLYLFTEGDVLAQPSAFQIRGGAIRTAHADSLAVSPAVPVQLGSEDKYIDSTIRILAVLPMGTYVSHAFGPFELSLVEDIGMNIDKGESKYRLAIGKLQAGRPTEMAAIR
ncbi:MAG TPA: hypothetical protein VGM92_04190 [Candidatus Kapabacteria bacterium]|jgi:hypothetical protein